MKKWVNLEEPEEEVQHINDSNYFELQTVCMFFGITCLCFFQSKPPPPPPTSFPKAPMGGPGMGPPFAGGPGAGPPVNMFSIRAGTGM